MNSNTPGSAGDANWRPPLELTAGRPREVRLSLAGRILIILAILLGVGSVAAGALLHVKSFSEREIQRQLAEAGRETEGRVLRTWRTKSGDAHYWVEYAYQAEGTLYRDRVQLGRRSWEAVKPGSTLQVRYLPANPGSNAVRGHEGRPMPLVIPYLVAGAMAVGAWLVTLPTRSQRHLLAEGRPARAVVTRHEKTKDGVVVHYEFRQLSGARAGGKSAQGKKPAPVGSSLCVLYEPDRVSHNAVYPLSLVRTRRQLRRAHA
jgi:hypothetical protein